MSAAARLAQLLQLTQDCGVVLQHPSSMRYFTGGFTGEGMVIITGTRRVIITDGRYARQAERQAPGFLVVEATMSVSAMQLLSRLCRRDDITTLRYEDDFISAHQYRQMHGMLGDHVTLLALYRTHHALRWVKQPQEIECIRQACRIADEALARIRPQLRSGLSENRLRALIESEMLLLGADSVAFDTIAAFGVDTAICHVRPGERVLAQGDLVLLDFGCRYHGYCCDVTRMFSLGTPGTASASAYAAVMQAHERCMQAIRPGAVCSEVDTLARDSIREAGYEGSFSYALGHAIGLDVHEEPQLSPVSHQPLQQGMVVTLEPGIYVPDAFGVRLEDTVLVTAAGAESLTASPRELIIL